jgi:hypothetical protein
VHYSAFAGSACFFIIHTGEGPLLAKLFVPSRVMHDKTKIMVKDQFVVGKEKKNMPPNRLKHMEIDEGD